MKKGSFFSAIHSLFEFLAYLIALWNIIILFFEPIVGYYMNISSAQNWTAVSNILFLLFTIIFRFISSPLVMHKGQSIADLVLLSAGTVLFMLDPKFLIFFMLIRQTYFIIRYLFFRAFEGALSKKMLRNPPVTFMVSFAITILVGTFLLMLPSSTNKHIITPFIDALFTATSATCVTGLTVVDTGTHYSLFGQLVILFLIQVGGLGIMTISTAFAVLLGQKLTLKVENVMQNVVGESMRFDMLALIKNILIVTFVLEAIGSAFLFLTFIKIFQPIKALYYAIFHSISAFCNAGFGLYPDNLMQFKFNFNVSMTVTLLIIFGGLGFSVIVDLWRHITNSKRRLSLSLHTKIVVYTTLFLLVFGTVAFFISEFNNTMKDFTIPQRLITSWFQSVTCRTAGFNTIDESQITPATSLFSMILMFIGASPGSTGGGVKTSTFALLLLSILTLVKGQNDLSIFKRKINPNSVRESVSLITVSVVLIFIIVFTMLIIDTFSLEKTMFEAISAFGTVGLSMGITPDLSSISKFLITLLMYIGRVGPLTMLFAFSQRRKVLHFTYAEEKISIG
jgi:trk system potassium uptake protein TrkH